VDQFHEIARDQSKRSLRRAKQGGVGAAAAVDFRRSLKGKAPATAGGGALHAIDEEFDATTARILGQVMLPHDRGPQQSRRAHLGDDGDTASIASVGTIYTHPAAGSPTSLLEEHGMLAAKHAHNDLALINNLPAGEEPNEIESGTNPIEATLCHRKLD